MLILVTMMQKKELENLPHDYSIIMSVKQSSELEFYKIFESISNPSVLVSLGRPACNVHHALKRHNISSKNLHIIDCISNEIDAEKVSNATYLHSRKNLGDLSLQIENAVASLPNSKRTLVFDSISKLSTSHDADTVVGFIKFLNARLKDMNTQAIFLSDKRSEHVNQRLSSIFDKSVSF